MYSDEMVGCGRIPLDRVSEALSYSCHDRKMTSSEKIFGTEKTNFNGSRIFFEKIY